MIHSIRWLVPLALVLVPPVHASVRVVAPTGAPYSTIQGAVDAAVDGDTLLVKPGTYAGFSVQSKSLTIAADPEGSVSLTSASSIASTSPTQSVVLSGFSFPAAVNGGMSVDSCAGPVRFEALTTTAPLASGSFFYAVVVQGSADVAILRCTLLGGDSHGAYPSNAGSGLEVWLGSRVALYDSVVAGGRGQDGQVIGPGLQYPPLIGAGGCEVFGSSTLFVSGSTIRGGQGGTGAAIVFVTGAHGGTGLMIEGGSNATLLDTLLQGGQGGNGGSSGPAGPNGASSVGSFTSLPGLSRHITAPTLVRELSSFTVNVAGLPGDQVWLQIGGTPAWSLDLAFSGVRLVSTAQRSTRYFLGVLPGSGTLTTTLVFPDMGPGVQARTNHVQALFRDTSGTNVLGTGEVFTLVDSAF